MPSNIDSTRPEDGTPASKADLRANLAAAKAELDHGGFAEGLAPANYAVATSRVSDHLAAIDAALGARGNASAFTALADTPTSYAGQANRYARVSADEKGLEFVDAAAGGDASMTTYTPTGSGAVATTIQAKLRETVSVRDFGAVGDGTTDDTAAFVLARQYAEASRRGEQVSYGNTDVRGNVAIYVPPGAYLITQKEAMVASVSNLKTYGLTWFGAPGTNITEIVFRPAGLEGGTPDTPFIVNDCWLGLRFYNLRFTCDTPGAWFMHSIANNNQQDYLFHDCTWDGAWGGGLYLTGADNNSEFKFYGCDINHFDMGPFLWSNDSDQFLNYWFYATKYWSSHAPMVRMTTGGHIHIFGLDVSNWCPDLAGNGLSEAFIFELLGNNHSQGVCQFACRDLRVESKDANGKLLYSEWPQGLVLFDGIDYSSQARWNVANYGDVIELEYSNADGPTYVFRDGDMAGGVLIHAGSGSYNRYHPAILFENLRWWDRPKPSDVVTYDVPTNAGGRPVVRFRNCFVHYYAHAEGHRAVWDADIGARYALAAQNVEKTLTVRGVNAGIVTSFSQRVKLPIGSIITSFSAIGKPGQSPETDSATYSLKSTESTPTTIAQVSASNPSTARSYTETPTNLPWFCDTVQTADLDIAAEANVRFNHNDLMFLIRYF